VVKEILTALYEFFLPLFVIGLIVFSSIYLSDKDNFRKQLQEMKTSKSKITFTIILVVLFPFAISLSIYIVKNIANIFG